MCAPYGYLDVVTSDEAEDLKRQYREKFEKGFPSYNPIDFPGTAEKRGCDEYLDAIRQCLQDGEPYDESLLWDGTDENGYIY